MNKDYLNAYISSGDGYGQYENIIASQSNSAGSKKLVLVTEICISGTKNYFKVLHNNLIDYVTTDFDKAKQHFNTIK